MEELLTYVQSNGRACPKPPYWADLQGILKRIGAEESEPVSLILAAWHITTDLQKADCLSERIAFAYRYGALNKVDHFLRSLSDEQWYHSGK